MATGSAQAADAGSADPQPDSGPDSGSATTIWVRVAALVVAIAVAQALYWLVMDTAFSPGRERGQNVASSELARISEPTLAAARAASFAPVEMPYTFCCEDNYHAVRFTFMLDAVPDAGMAVRPLGQLDNFLIYANGSLIYSEGEMQQGRQSFHGQLRRLHNLPSGLLRRGENELLFITVRSGGSYTDFKAPQIGPQPEMQAAHGTHLYLINEYRHTMAAIMAVVGLFSLLVAWRSADRRILVWLAVLAFAWVGYALSVIWPDPPWNTQGRQIFYFTHANLVPVALLGFIDSWTGKPVRKLHWALPAAYCLVMAVISTVMLTGEMPARFDMAGQITDWFTRGLTVLAGARLIWHMRDLQDRRYIEIAVLVVMVTALGMASWFRVAGPFTQATPFMLLALAAGFISRNVRLFRSQAQINADLQQLVRLREAEIAEVHEREKHLLREHAHQDERRRIMRDMHDGMGSNLMSMLLAARRGKADPQWVARGLQTVIDEMRLMIDSMDSVGESLRSAMVLFRERAQTRTTDAGFAFDWQDHSQGKLDTLPPRAVLQVFRILQEAITNALKHSTGKTISVRVYNSRIEVADDGGSFDGPRDGGRGLENMASRARSFGGSFAMRRQNGQTLAVLDLPLAGEGE